MFCPKCGNTLPDGAAFCNKCGAQLQERVSTAATPAPTANTPRAAHAAPAGVTASVGSLDIFGLGSVAAAVVAVIGLFLKWINISFFGTYSLPIVSFGNDEYTLLSVLESLGSLSSENSAEQLNSLILVLWAIALISLVVAIISRFVMPGNKLPMLAAAGFVAILSLVWLIAMVVINNEMVGDYASAGASIVSSAAGPWVTLIASIAALALTIVGQGGNGAGINPAHVRTLGLVAGGLVALALVGFGITRVVGCVSGTFFGPKTEEIVGVWQTTSEFENEYNTRYYFTFYETAGELQFQSEKSSNTIFGWSRDMSAMGYWSISGNKIKMESEGTDLGPMAELTYSNKDDNPTLSVNYEGAEVVLIKSD